jgi:hypothetical protein
MIKIIRYHFPYDIIQQINLQKQKMFKPPCSLKAIISQAIVNTCVTRKLKAGSA